MKPGASKEWKGDDQWLRALTCPFDFYVFSDLQRVLSLTKILPGGPTWHRAGLVEINDVRRT